MKFSRLFRLGKQGYNAYRSYKGGGRRGYSSGYGRQQFGGSGSRRGGSTLERLIRRFLK